MLIVFWILHYNTPGVLLVLSLILDLNNYIFGLFLIFKSKLFHNETEDGIKDVLDILSLLLGVEYYLSNMQTINYARDRKHFQCPGRKVPFVLRRCVHFFRFFFFFLPFKCISVFVFAIVLLFSGWAEVAIAHAKC